jgi:transposase
MNKITRVGVDVAKNVIQVHAVDAAGHVVTNRALKREKFLLWCTQLPAGCLIAMEACSGAHHWCRKLIERGFDARMIPAHSVTAYRIQGRSGKNDVNDAAAVCEAASRPHMIDVPPKTLAQQGMLCVHRLREGLKEERTACINRIRGLLAEFGVVLPQSPEALRQHLSDVIEDGSNDIAGMARLVLQRAQEQWREMDAHIKWCDQRIADHQRGDEQVQRAAELMGVGTITASAVVATVGDFKQFKNGAQFGAWLGLTPKQNSSGGKSSLGGISKRGNDYLRTLLIQGAKAITLTRQYDNPIFLWVQKLRERVGWQKAVVALANKNVRILWAVMTREKRYDAHHASVYPLTPTLDPS